MNHPTATSLFLALLLSAGVMAQPLDRTIAHDSTALDLLPIDQPQVYRNTGASIIAITLVAGGVAALHFDKNPAATPGTIIALGGLVIGTSIYFRKPDKPNAPQIVARR